MDGGFDKKIPKPISWIKSDFVIRSLRYANGKNKESIYNT